MFINGLSILSPFPRNQEPFRRVKSWAYYASLSHHNAFRVWEWGISHAYEMTPDTLLLTIPLEIIPLGVLDP